MKIVVIGSNGQLGTDLMKVLSTSHEMIGLTHKEIEVSDSKSCHAVVDLHPDVVINTAAFHKMDRCEDDPVKTFAVNTLGARNVAMATKEAGATDVYISTDYVFDGTQKTPYTEDSIPRPINTYGVSKLAGEAFTILNPKHYVVRISSVFGVAGASGKGGNFVETMISKAKKGDAISVIGDMWMSPTYTRDACFLLKGMLEFNLPSGTYHASNEGYCTWHEFTKAIFDILSMKPALSSIKAEQFPTKAQRPVFSAMKSIRLPKHGIRPRPWKEALNAYLAEKGHLSPA